MNVSLDLHRMGSYRLGRNKVMRRAAGEEDLICGRLIHTGGIGASTDSSKSQVRHRAGGIDMLETALEHSDVSPGDSSLVSHLSSLIPILHSYCHSHSHSHSHSLSYFHTRAYH